MIEFMACPAPALIVPFGLSLIAPGSPDAAFRALRKGLPFAALLVVASFLLAKGALACALALPWLLLTLLGALSGAARLLRKRWTDISETCHAAALLFLPVGAVWLCLSRLGTAPMGFQEPIVLLTAVHFHYTGFAAPILMGIAIRRFPHDGRMLQPAGLGFLAGTPLLAAGFALASPPLKYAAVLLLCASLLTLALVQMANLTSFDTVQDGLAHPLLALSALGLACGMLLAAAYGSGEFVGDVRIGIQRMAIFHGISNGIGFSLLGLLGWRRDRGL